MLGFTTRLLGMLWTLTKWSSWWVTFLARQSGFVCRCWPTQEHDADEETIICWPRTSLWIYTWSRVSGRGGISAFGHRSLRSSFWVKINTSLNEMKLILKINLMTLFICQDGDKNHDWVKDASNSHSTKPTPVLLIGIHPTGVGQYLCQLFLGGTVQELCRSWGISVEKRFCLMSCTMFGGWALLDVASATTEANPSDVWPIFLIISVQSPPMVHSCTPQLQIHRCIKRYTIPWLISVVPFVHPDLVANLRLCIDVWCWAVLKVSYFVAD